MFLASIFGSTLLLSMVVARDVIQDVAFTALIRQDLTTTNSQIVVYPDVHTNEGNGYNSDTGIFTAPKDGIYVFHFHALSSKGKDFWLDLYKNEDQYLISAFGRQSNDYASGGNTVTLKLIEFDNVYVKARRTAYIYGTYGDTYASFTGYLLSTSAVNEKIAQ